MTILAVLVVGLVVLGKPQKAVAFDCSFDCKEQLVECNQACSNQVGYPDENCLPNCYLLYQECLGGC